VTVLHLISSGGYYGAENMLVTLVRALKALGVESVIAAFRNTQKPHLEILNSAAREKVPVEPISCNGRIDLSTVRGIRECLGRYGARILHTHGYKADIYGYAAVGCGPTPIIATCHNWTNDTRLVQLYGRCDRWILRRFPAVVAVSNTVATLLRRTGIRAGVIEVVPNGIDVDRFGVDPERLVSTRPKGLVVGTAGRLVPQKGLLDIVAIAPALLAKFPDTQFFVAGDGPQRAELEVAVRAKGVADAFVFAGTCKDMARVYKAMDIFVLPSLNEAMPMTILEAMAARLPIAATRVGGIPEIVDDDCGRLFSAGDQAGLIAAVSDLLSDAQKRLRMGTAGRARIERQFSSSAMARQYIRIYERLLGGACAT
jgi:glycosyltransferase involved in cell wall biosynthesis